VPLPPLCLSQDLQSFTNFILNFIVASEYLDQLLPGGTKPDLVGHEADGPEPIHSIMRL
jgi:hypothetical protein